MCSRPKTTLTNPAFLVGCPRSGTTLLQRLLDAHPAIAIAPETHFIRRFWLKQADYGSLTQTANYHRLVSDIIAMPEFAEMELSATDFKEAAQGIDRTYANLLGLLLSQFQQIKQTTLVGEKTPNHLLYMPTLQTFFPEAKFIHIVRDPRAVVNSWRKVPWSTGSIKGDAEVWRRYMATARQFNSDHQTFIWFNYEQLIAETEAVLKKVCHFLDISFDPAMLHYHQQTSKQVNITREPWKQNVQKPVNTASLMQWQKDLSPQAIASIEAVTAPEMKRLGYGRQSSFWRFSVAASLLEAKRVWRLIKSPLKQKVAS